MGAKLYSPTPLNKVIFMSGLADNQNLSKTWHRKLSKDWEIDRLLTDLEARTQNRYRQNTKKDLLLGLLCGHSLKKNWSRFT
ncbi:hypothetical protein ACX27_18915 [Nostoc piscinale CENA21]|uniref:Uncharacterized protein n=1 Tax=Nostoc piscinale CENA21 TaxID=224013 RepID=A0A0M3V5S9_9NOSO|nr:hypothetical protein ACX27_18915 [Nostoc piscinale CENA21]